MARPPETVETALTELQRVVRLPPPTDPPVPTFPSGEVPEDLATKDATVLFLTSEELEMLATVQSLLPEDQRFEHMDKSTIEAATFRFVCLTHFTHDEDHVEGFRAEHARGLLCLTCFFPVEDLTVADEIAAYGVRFIPADKVSLPPVFGRDPRPTMASVVAVDNCTGTDHTKIAARARASALHALRVLRAVLREDLFIQDRQLRFRLGESTWFSDGASGWDLRPEEAWGYELTEEALKLADPPPVSSLQAGGEDDVERAANRALRWFEQAQLAVDPLIELLYLFFALEAIIGDKENEKGRPLAVRRAILGLKTTGYFSHPGRTYLYYGRVRSTAVHGGDPPEVPRDEIDKFAADVRRALNEFLKYARDNGIAKRAWVVKALDSDPRKDQIAQRFLKGQ
jgi:hypothetical protein